ncbi:MAG: S8 family serine peptidase [Faecalibacterium sp.]|nr:S8 family serine peptidase [Ruminococcus sp.]MCM1485149.1 S8 family serine peptidase [Faecalibacterium sp.]
MKAILTVILCFFLELSSLFGGVGKVETPKTDGALYADDEIVSVIVELDVAGMLEGIKNSQQRKEVIDNFIGSEKYEKIKQAQESVTELIKSSIKAADFSNSFTYSFIADGFSLELPYKYVKQLEKLAGVKQVKICAAFEQPDAVNDADGDKSDLAVAGKFTGIVQAQQTGYTGKGTVVAILDTGFQLDHEAFDFEVESPRLSKQDINLMTTVKALNTIVPRWGANYYSQKIPYKWDYAEIDKTVNNEYSGHGTHVAGIVGGKSDKITGVAPDAQLLCMKVFGDEEGSLAQEHVTLAALDDAVKLNADVINMSLGSPSGQEPDNIFTWDVIRRLEKAGISVVCSAGNDSSLGKNDATAGTTTVNADLIDYGVVGSPSSYEWCMSIASSAVNSKSSTASGTISVSGVGTQEMSSFSSWGVTADMKLKPEITAPGSSILSSVPGNSYAYYSGTSMAAPYYTGSFALIKQYIDSNYPSMAKKESAEMINSILMSTATAFRGYGQSTYYSPRRQGAGLVNLDAALISKAYLTTTDNTRPKLELGEDTDNTLEMSFVVHNMSADELTYTPNFVALTDSYRKSGDTYINTLTAKKLTEKTQYTLEYIKGVNDDGTITVSAKGSTKISLKVTFKDSVIEAQKVAFKNGFFLDGFIFLESETQPTLSIPYMSFFGDWDNGNIFDNTMYDGEPSYLGKQWGLMVTDGDNYYPMGANIFEDEIEYNIDSKYCAFSKNAFGYTRMLENPYVTVSVGLLRNCKRMDYNLFTKSGFFRYCGSTMLDYCRKTINPNKSNIGVLWGGGGLINGNEYVYKVSTTPHNMSTGRTTIEFPFIVDNDAPTIESCTYEKTSDGNILKIKIHDNRYVMGFEVLSEYGDSIAKVSFKGVDPVDGTYTYEMNVSECAGDDFDAYEYDSISVYVLDYAYNETFSTIELNDKYVIEPEISFDVVPEIKSYSFTQNTPVVEIDSQKETETVGGPFSKIIDALRNIL